ncbi:branched-chain amino acid ABC transporter permease [Segnochrobactrum spirostomi]|uniref:Branched-chain amino acid ABC transporter permease n=1 Tax=Segnochrobactrum spirostomi TaxID=2608987 RepID=A0A6A7Y691_9HYPH|nr:branched-chain amino acid ABC transporter permease [Segnochrobactrum spirostomi]MQT14754.1 branched-chain amino acid ABC transporter permease [Segnochrobactrum spirostomi]
MTFAAVTSSYRLERRRGGALAEALRIGLFGGLAAIAFALVGAYTIMDGRPVIEGVLTLAQTVLVTIGLATGAFGARAAGAAPAATRLAHGAAAGLLAGILLAALVLLVSSVNLRATLVAASPALVRALSFGLGLASTRALACLAVGGAMLGLAGSVLTVLPPVARRAVVAGLAAAVAAGLFRDVFASILDNVPGLRGLESAIFGFSGVNPAAAVVLCLAAAALSVGRSALRGRALSERSIALRKRIGLALMIVAILALPLVTNAFVAQVAMLVALYILMGMGLNIELGLAGLVDLGFVAFFAVGAYTVALLSSNTPFAIAHVSFWIALPIAVALAAVAGLLFGLPVLRVRGDYLAMATLGLGEIVRVLVLSDALAPVLGGSQGIIEIARPRIGGLVLNTPADLYYLALAIAAIVGLVSWRLQHSRIGRAWLAVREDEDVAQALGIDLVAMKLLAYTVGAAFAGAAGAVFAVLIGSVFPHSFQLLVSINVLAILVIGGLGSLPGVVVGAIALIGLPELLREFGEFRYLFYGLALVAMMHLKAEGLWPAHAKETSHV